jgi:hypothetical protein
MASTTKSATSEPAREGNRYTRAARVLAKNDKLSVKELADRAFMSETTAARCLEAWHACVAALIEVGRLPDPAKKVPAAKKVPKVTPTKTKPPAATETNGEAAETVETAGTIETAPI